MSSVIDARLSRLRGKLPAEQPGARGLERVARNPECMRLRALTIAGITPHTAATKIYQEPSKEGQSPFALAVGNQFERNLFDAGASKLLDLYRKAGLLSVQECKVVNMADFAPLPTSPQKLPLALARRRAESERLLRLKKSGSKDAPNIIIKPRLYVQLLGIGHAIEPDALVAADNEPSYRPIEAKSYPDRRGKTDAADIRSACRQAAVSVVALRQAAERQGMSDGDVIVPAKGDLVLRITGSMGATLNSMELRSEVASLERAIGEAPRNLEELEELVGGETLDNPDVLNSIPPNYRSSCREHCALAGKCKQEAMATGEPVVIGDRARELLAPAGTITRAIDLMNGRGALPRNAEERVLAEQLREGLAAYREAV